MEATTELKAYRFLSPEWAEAARASIDSGPAQDVVSRKQESYWEWIADTRQDYSYSWALGARFPTGDVSYLLLNWQKGACVAATVVEPGVPVSADFVITATEDTWRRFFAHELNLQRMVVDRQLRLEQGNILIFFRGVFFFVESLAALERVPTEFTH